MSSAVINATQDYPFTKRHCLSVSDYHRVDIENLLHSKTRPERKRVLSLLGNALAQM